MLFLLLLLVGRERGGEDTGDVWVSFYLLRENIHSAESMHVLKLDPESQSIGFKRVAAPIKDVFYSELIELGGYDLLVFDPS